MILKMASKFVSRVVHLILSHGQHSMARFKSNLEVLGLAFLMEFPWSISNVLLLAKEKFWETEYVEGGQIRDQPIQWTLEVISRAYHSPVGGEGMLDGDGEHRGYIESKLRPGTWNQRNGWHVESCWDSHLSHLFAFLMPILNPKKPGRISLAWATTIICSLENKV